MAFATSAAPAQRLRRQGSYANHRRPDVSQEAILDILDPAYVEFGLSWYTNAHEYAQDLHPDPEVGAGIIAALSPQNSWEANLDDAIQLMRTGDCGQYQDAVTKALRIRAGEHPLDVLGGRKVRSFFANIAYPNRPGPVTVDRHTLALTLGRPREQTRANPVPPHVLKPGLYHQISAEFRALARNLGILPHQLQAWAWVSYTNNRPEEF